MSLRDSFLSEIAPTTARPDLVAQLDQVTAIVDRIWEVPARARLPRFSTTQRQDLAARTFQEQRALTNECVALLRRLQQGGYPRPPAINPDELQELVDKEIQVQRLLKGAERLERTATDGLLVASGLLATLNGKVLRHVRERLRAKDLPRAAREALASRWDAVLLLLDRRRAAAEAGQKRLERRAAELLAEAEAAARSQAVTRALQRLRALLAAREGGRP